MGDGDDQGDTEPRAVARSTSDATSGTRVACSIPLRRVRAGEVRCEDFLYEFKAGPAGGRLRRPSSAGAKLGRPVTRRRKFSPSRRYTLDADRQPWRTSSSVRRQGQTKSANDDPLLLRFVQFLLPLLAVSGILVYTLLTIHYERFYGALAIKPADVGLSYAGTLASSTGYVLYLIIGAIFAGLVAFVLTSLRSSLGRRHWKPADIVADGRRTFENIPRRNLDSGLTGGRLSRSGAVRISTYFRTL